MCRGRNPPLSPCASSSFLLFVGRVEHNFLIRGGRLGHNVTAIPALLRFLLSSQWLYRFRPGSSVVQEGPWKNTGWTGGKLPRSAQLPPRYHLKSNEKRAILVEWFSVEWAPEDYYSLLFSSAVICNLISGAQMHCHVRKQWGRWSFLGFLQSLTRKVSSSLLHDFECEKTWAWVWEQHADRNFHMQWQNLQEFLATNVYL